MTPFQQRALVLVVIWILIVVVRFRRSTPVLIGGLVAVALYAMTEIIRGGASIGELGLLPDVSLPKTIALVVVWLALMLVYSPIADRIATRMVAAPPTLGAFRALQESRVKLVAGIVVAWILGGFLEELVFRGIVLKAVEAEAFRWIAGPVAAMVAICVAAAGAGVMHLYQGPRAALIITQLSILFGALFVISGYNLWAVMLCHGLYDTIAFIRFANKKSKYSELDSDRGEMPSRAS
jgi:membrane protease YdiL (CAAX protease family)